MELTGTAGGMLSGMVALSRFDFDFDPRFRVPLALAGITPSTTAAYLRDGCFEVRFGAWSLQTPTENIAQAELIGPFRWYRSVGVRLSLHDRGVTFGTTARRGACLGFREPVSAVAPFGLLPHPNATVTLREPEALMLALRDLDVPLVRGASTG